MDKIIYFKESVRKNGVIHFVKDFRKKSFFGKERVNYSIISTEAHLFEGSEKIPEFIADKILNDFPNAVFMIGNLSKFCSMYHTHRFWVIARYTEKAEEYYCGEDRDGKPEYTRDIEDVILEFSESSAKETLRTIQQRTRDKVFVRPLYMNFENGLLTPCMMITCTSKSGKQETKYFKKMDGNRLRLVRNSDSAKFFTYEEVLKMFEYLQTHNKNFLYAVLPVFKDNVYCKNIEAYMRENKVSRMIQMTTKLRWLNR